MIKNPYLLIVNDKLNVSCGNKDWRGFFSSYEEAKARGIQLTRMYSHDGKVPQRDCYKYWDVIDIRQYLDVE
jgi:hypothetical protein